MEERDLRALAAVIRPLLPELVGDAAAAAELDARLTEALDLTPGRAKGVLRRLLLLNAHNAVREWTNARLPPEADALSWRSADLSGVFVPETVRGSQIPPETGANIDLRATGWSRYDQQVLRFHVAELGSSPLVPLAAGRDYTGVFSAGPGQDGNLFGLRDMAFLGDLPRGGLATRWVVRSRTAVLAPAVPTDPEVIVDQAEAGLGTQWMATFRLHIPRSGDSVERRVLLRPLGAPEARIDVLVYVGDDVYRELTVSLSVSPAPGGSGTPLLGPVVTAVSEQFVNAEHADLKPAAEWQTPVRQLGVHVLGQAASVTCDALGLTAEIDWAPDQGTVETSIAAVRSALDKLRDKHITYFNRITDGDLRSALSAYRPQAGQWPPPRAGSDPVAAQAWAQVASSPELHELAFYGHNLYTDIFGDSLRDLIATELAPGDLLKLTWCEGWSNWVPRLPLALMYLDEPDPDQPVNPGRFLGLRHRLGYTRVTPRSASRALGDWWATTRAHLLYWGAGQGDELAEEARRHRAELASWPGGLQVLPDAGEAASGSADARSLARYLRSPEPDPVSLLYLYCHYHDPVLRFGPATGPASELRLPDIGTSQLKDAPMVFVNACATGTAAPLLASGLMDQFFRRGCRAYIGTEAKVPAGLAARFATTFFSFLYGDAGRTIAPVGEAIAQARRFLWQEYRNIGGLFYTYVNDYALYAADSGAVGSLRRSAT